MICLYQRYNNDTKQYWAYLHDFIVLPEYRNKGVGSALMDYIVADARKRNFKYLDLAIWSKNSGAEKMYKKYKFKNTEKRMRRFL